ncbi:GlxA family transcriptional regulator [Pelagibius sp. Alg239-R121]|uniref:GlxA family transcriptional regulator n=1 Tax=Pelagibius sp. Alg239-R121 TaxID=2993448 RepID=UPI0024A75FCB|nr:helix-turn-helix domain-containing protein [Pelagibius sp. Alg239-R121]
MDSLEASNSGAPPRFNFLLQPEFPLNALILASDALRIANQNSGRQLFDWSFISESGEPVRASNGMWFDVDSAIQDMPVADVYLLFEGNLPTQRNSQRLLGHLRAAARFGAIVGGVDTGAFALAQAGLVGGSGNNELVLHWEAVPAFQERFPTATLKNQIYLINDNQVHCAGGVATLDMVLDLIARFNGDALANEVANALVHSRREPMAQQRDDGQLESEQNSPSERIVSLMERNLDFPLGLNELASELGLSQRSLSRLCKRTFGESPMRLYLHVRLQAARNFLFYEEFSIKDVAIACGFSYPAVFSRVFKAQFGQTPRAFRAALRESQSLAMRPEIRRLISAPTAGSRFA